MISTPTNYSEVNEELRAKSAPKRLYSEGNTMPCKKNQVKKKRTLADIWGSKRRRTHYKHRKATVDFVKKAKYVLIKKATKSIRSSELKTFDMVEEGERGSGATTFTINGEGGKSKIVSKNI